MDARVKYLQENFPDLKIWEATSDADTPTGVPTCAVCFRLAPGFSTAFKDEPWITLCTCEKSRGRREYNISHCPCFSSRASASATAPTSTATTADDDALTADADNTFVLEIPQDPKVAWGDALTLKVQLRDCNGKTTRKFACLPSTIPSGRMQDMSSSNMPNTHSTPDAAIRVMALQPTGNVKRVSTVEYEGPDTSGTVVLTIPSTGMLPVGSYLSRSKARLTMYIYDGADWAELPDLNVLVTVIPGKPSMAKSEMRLIQPDGSGITSTSNDERGLPYQTIFAGDELNLALLIADDGGHRLPIDDPQHHDVVVVNLGPTHPRPPDSLSPGIPWAEHSAVVDDETQRVISTRLTVSGTYEFELRLRSSGEPCRQRVKVRVVPGLPCESETSIFSSKTMSLEFGLGELSFIVRDEHGNSYDQQDVQEHESNVDLPVRIEASAPLTCTLRSGPAPGRGTVALQLDADKFIDYFPEPLSLRLFCRHPAASQEIVAASVPVKVSMPKQPQAMPKPYLDLAKKRRRRIRKEHNEIRDQLLAGNEEVEKMKKQTDLDNNQEELAKRQEECLALYNRGMGLRKILSDLETTFP